MVEFGLKLEDNKVDEWSNKYIDYEKLKAVLKRAKSGLEYRDALLKRSPSAVAAEVIQTRKDLNAGEVATPVSHSGPAEKVLDPQNVSSGRSPSGESQPCDFDDVTISTAGDGRYSVDQSGDDTATDASPLLGVSSPRSKRSGLGGQIQKNVIKVTSYLGLADDRSLLIQAFAEADEKLNLFQQSYEKEITKVNEFYDEQLDDVKQRMYALTESVDTSHAKRSRKTVRKSMLTNTMADIVKRVLPKEMSTRFIDVNFPVELHAFSEDMEDEDMDLEFRSGHGTADNQSKEALMRNKLDVVREADSIKRAIADVYRTAKLLHNYSIMNYTGFVKIAKKFDKTFPDHRGMFRNNICDDGRQAELLAARIERLYSRWFCDGDIREAQAQLLTKRSDGLMMDWTQLRLGYRLGMCSILALWVAWDCIWGQFAKGEVSIGGRTAFPVFRGCLGLLVWHWFWGMSVYVWTRHRINYIYLFDFDPRTIDTPIGIFNDAVDETLVFFICMLLYYKAGANDMPQIVPPGAYPMFLIVYTAKCLIFPWKARKPLWIAVRQVVSAPLVSPTFFLTYVADVFTSMVKVFQDLFWTICFVVSGDWLFAAETEESHAHLWAQSFWYKNVAIPLICLLPLWIRFNQCLRRYLDTGKRFPNLANAGKYALSQSVTLFGAFHPLYLMRSRHAEANMLDYEDKGHHASIFQIFWMGLFIASSLYSFFWDVYMDWGLGRRQYGFLGQRLMYPRRSYYYLVISADLVLRFMWVLTLIPPQSGAKFELPAYLSAISMTVELFRRTIWSFFRLEHEHRQNTEGYRRVGVVPLHFNTGHKHKYHERHWVGWKVLVEIVVVTSIVIAISAFSVIAAQRAEIRTHLLQATSHGAIEL